MFYFLAALLGSVVGTAEIVSRYKDAPERALRTIPAWLYIALNAIASLSAYVLVKLIPTLDAIGGQGATGDLIKALAAGLSAMALFRSSLFTVRVGTSDIGIGPAAFLQILLQAADRATDRARASPRADAVQKIMTGVSFERAKSALPALCLSLMQGLTPEEQAALGNAVKQLDANQMEDGLKAYSLGLSLMNLVGDEVLRVAVDMLRNDILAKPKPVVQSFETLGLLKNVDFAQSHKTLVEACILAANVHDRSVIDTLQANVDRLAALALADQMKTLTLSRMLVDLFGEETVQLVLRSLPENQAKPPPR